MLTSLALNKQNGSGGTLTSLSVSYSYNSAGQLATITGTAATASTTATLAYNLGTGAQSSLTTALPGDDLVTSYLYNASTGLLEHVTTMRGSTNIYEEDLFYPAAGTAHYDQVSRKQITKRLESGGTATTQHFYTCFSYDSLDQLTAMTTYSGVYGSTESHTTLASETFAYDSLGNRTDLGFTSDNMNLYLTDAQGNALSYNARGDLTQTTTWDYTWDALDRLTFAAPANHALSAEGFTYDYMNRLTSRSTYHWDSGTNNWCVQADTTIQFVYDGWMLVAKIDAATGHMLQSYTWDPTKEAGVGGLLSETIFGNVGGTWQATATYVPVYDSNADVMALVNQATGVVAATYTYSAFGTLLSHTWNATGTDPNDILFSSHMVDPGTGLIYMKERWYSPTLGRFISLDPIGIGKGDRNH